MYVALNSLRVGIASTTTTVEEDVADDDDLALQVNYLQISVLLNLLAQVKGGKRRFQVRHWLQLS